MKETKQLIAKIESTNSGAHFSNVTVKLENKKSINIKVEQHLLGQLKIGKLYLFNVLEVNKDEEVILKSVSFENIEKLYDKEKLAEIYPAFFQAAPISFKEIKKGIEGYIKEIKNPILASITKNLYQKYKGDFYIHPAATKNHHAYYGGLSYHTLTMLRLIKPFIEVYPYIDYDLMLAGTLLHDIAKVGEISGVDGEYTPEGMLIGHIVQGTIEIELVAKELGYENEEVVLLLKHMLVAHHGMLAFGSPKRPQTAESLLLWYIDTMDSKFAVLEEELAKTKPGEFTNQVNVLDKVKFYKPKNSK